MRFTILTQYYPPEIGAPQARLSELANYLVACGHSVTVLTSMPNYPKGRIYPGYGGFIRQETVAGIRLIRTLIFPSRSARLFPRMLNYLSFVLSSALVGTFLLDTSDFIIVESPPLFLGFAGLWLRWCKRAKLVFNVADLWPESAVELGIVAKSSLAIRLAYRFERSCYRSAWLITGQSESIVANIRSRFPERPVYHLSNGVDTQCFNPDRITLPARALLGTDDQFVAVYAGLHGLAQGLRQVMEAARVLNLDERFRFVFIGEGPEKECLKRLAKEMGLANVSFLDPRPHSEIPGILAAADAILVPLVCQITGAVPSKIYEAMASGRPLIVIASGEPAEIINEHNAGLIVTPRDIEGLVNALRSLRDDCQLAKVLGENGRNAAVTHFDRRDILERFTKFLVTNKESDVPRCSVTFVSPQLPRIDS